MVHPLKEKAKKSAAAKHKAISGRDKERNWIEKWLDTVPPLKHEGGSYNPWPDTARDKKEQD